MIQVTPQMRILVAVEPADFRRGIDGLARVCREVLKQDPFAGWVFVFRNRRATSVKVLVYDGQGFWLCQRDYPEAGFAGGRRGATWRRRPWRPTSCRCFSRRAIPTRRRRLPGGESVRCLRTDKKIGLRLLRSSLWPCYAAGHGRAEVPRPGGHGCRRGLHP